MYKNSLTLRKVEECDARFIEKKKKSSKLCYEVVVKDLLNFFEGKARKVRTNWYFEKKLKKSTRGQS